MTPPTTRVRACSRCGDLIFEDTRPGRPRVLCDGCQTYKIRRGKYLVTCPCGAQVVGATAGRPSIYCSAEHSRKAQAVARYGITLADYYALLHSQGSSCAICRVDDETYGTLFIDHEHSSGRVRGLLCGHCNFGLGHFRDSVDLLTAATSYIERADTAALADVPSTEPPEGPIQAPHLDAFLP